MGQIAEHLTQVRERIRAAAERVGRRPEDVRLIAVSKTKPLPALLEAYEAGVRDFGENYVQEILEKAPALPADARIHMIGHLQTNKAGKIAGLVSMIHSIDSLHLLEKLSREAEKQGLTSLSVLLEVNIAAEETKFGFSAEEVLPVIREAAVRFPRLMIRGLMTSAPITENAETNRPYFAAMKKLLLVANEMIREDREGVFARAHMEPLTELSMGMTGDFEAAVEEGATMVRIGTAIFGARDYSAGK